MVPNYMQLPGLVRALGATLKPWPLRPDFERRRWTADPGELARLVTPRTRLIALCHPNNPTGARLSADELDAVGRLADEHGAWVLCDEIYAGSELDSSPTLTVWGRCERPLVTSSLSKAYGLPGLRLGWIAAPPEACADFWEHHDHTSIGPGAASDFVATRVLGRRAAHLERMRAHLQRNWAVIADWLARHAERLRFIPPEAGAMLYATYEAPIASGELARRLLAEESCLIVPGDQYGMERWLRIGFGGETATVAEGLRRVERVLARVAAA
jgi:aspartate/methionine/tyrosine aminotransferase